MTGIELDVIDHIYDIVRCKSKGSAPIGVQGEVRDFGGKRCGMI
jgi:hypothetical protein